MSSEHVQGDADLRKIEQSYIVNINETKYLDAKKRFQNVHKVDDIQSSVNQLISSVTIIIERLDALDLELIDIKDRLNILEAP